MALLEVRDLTVEYASTTGVVRAVDEVSLDLETGEVLGVVGESGSGKTTLVLAALRLVPEPGRVVGGCVRLRGEDLRQLSPGAMRRLRGKEIAYVPQAAMSSLNPVMTVGAQIGESLELHTDLVGERAEARVRDVLEMVELGAAVASRYPHELSGGMRQRAVIAMALVAGPSVVLADEPTSGLDVLVRVQVLRLVRRIAADLGLSLLLVSHDLPLVSRWCDRAVVMYAGRIVEEAPAGELLTAALHPYTQGLARSLPRLRGQFDPVPIGGEVPDLSRLPLGCAFQDRCPRVTDICRKHVPQLVPVAGHRVACHLYDERR
ncbi:MAG: ABC transporter ATP-binding protein [Actinomycetota bacterium]|nr:ABC transporter ATP-binding protein [Actinomycetota bacterium]